MARTVNSTWQPPGEPHQRWCSTRGGCHVCTSLTHSCSLKEVDVEERGVLMAACQRDRAGPQSVATSARPVGELCRPLPSNYGGAGAKEAWEDRPGDPCVGGQYRRGARGMVGHVHDARSDRARRAGWLRRTLSTKSPGAASKIARGRANLRAGLRDCPALRSAAPPPVARGHGRMPRRYNAHRRVPSCTVGLRGGRSLWWRARHGGVIWASIPDSVGHPLRHHRSLQRTRQHWHRTAVTLLSAGSNTMNPLGAIELGTTSRMQRLASGRTSASAARAVRCAAAASPHTSCCWLALGAIGVHPAQPGQPGRPTKRAATQRGHSRRARRRNAPAPLSYAPAVPNARKPGQARKVACSVSTGPRPQLTSFKSASPVSVDLRDEGSGEACMRSDAALPHAGQGGRVPMHEGEGQRACPHHRPDGFGTEGAIGAEPPRLKISSRRQALLTLCGACLNSPRSSLPRRLWPVYFDRPGVTPRGARGKGSREGQAGLRRSGGAVPVGAVVHRQAHQRHQLKGARRHGPSCCVTGARCRRTSPQRTFRLPRAPPWAPVLGP
eukprot:134264-Chlamydomonas_euryale.AAC.9